MTESRYNVEHKIHDAAPEACHGDLSHWITAKQYHPHGVVELTMFVKTPELEKLYLQIGEILGKPLDLATQTTEGDLGLEESYDIDAQNSAQGGEHG
jgi:hypothetical protein